SVSCVVLSCRVNSPMPDPRLIWFEGDKGLPGGQCIGWHGHRLDAETLTTARRIRQRVAREDLQVVERLVDPHDNLGLTVARSEPEPTPAVWVAMQVGEGEVDLHVTDRGRLAEVVRRPSDR